MPARAVSGPYRIWVTLLCVALPVLTLGLLGMVPSLVLAVGRRRRVDVVGAVVIGLMQLAMYVSVGLTPTGGQIDNWTALLLVLPLWLGAPVHFVLLNQRRCWPAAAPPAHPYPAYPAAGAYPYAAPPQAPTLPMAPAPYPPAGPPAADAPSGATGTAELRELGELLRRQAGDGQR
ncbi:hypothetical protein [Kitasatospora sp. NPDC004531]